MQISWGKPKIYVKKIGSNTTWSLVPTPVEDSTQLNTEQGERLEAKIEGGENEDVRVKRSSYELVFQVRKVKGRKAPIASVDGVVTDEYQVMVQPEDPECPGFSIDKASVNVVETFTTADGAMWEYHFNVLKPDSGEMVKWGTVTVTGDTPSIEVDADD